MSTEITDTAMNSTVTRHNARFDPETRRWAVTWLPGVPLDRNQAVTAMTIAETVAALQVEGQTAVVDHSHRMWPQLVGWAAELGLTGPDAVVRASEPPDDQGERP